MIKYLMTWITLKIKRGKYNENPPIKKPYIMKSFIRIDETTKKKNYTTIVVKQV